MGNKKRSALILLSSLFLTIFLFTACGGFRFGGREESGAVEMEKDYYADQQTMERSEAPAPEMMAEPMPSEGPAGGAAADSASSGAARPPREQERKRVYYGYVSLLVDEIEEEKSRIAAIADTNGGYVESSFGSSMIIRVPVLKFDEVMDEILALEEVLHKSVETFDVTEYFQDLSTRITIAESTRERLYLLLEKTEDVDERVKILREIRRLTEEIERINATLETLKKQIAYSRITVDLVSRLEQYAMERDVIPFDWIGSLNPLTPTIVRMRGKVEFPLDDEYALFSKEKYFRAENADLVRIRVGTITNRPEGDAGFWQKALSFHLSPFYRTTEEKDLGQVRGVVFTSKDVEPFVYFVGVTVKRKRLYIIEVFFPDPATFEAESPGIFRSVEQFQVR